MNYFNKKKTMKSYSQCGQDLFVYYLNEGKPGKFLDLGCSLPKKINNTYLLELNGWDGISLDIQNFSEQWQERKCKFIQADCLNQNYNELLKDFFKPEFANGLTSEGGDKVNINIQSGAAGKFIALYGIDEIIDNLKDSINILIIENPANGPEVALDIPASISRFNNLGTLMLTNIVRSLPDSIGDLKQLNTRVYKIVEL